MYKITAAHPTLPIPSYARVTNLVNGKQIIVRINDRGPFHSNRIIDLSFTAALKLDYLGKGSGLIEVERLLPEDIAKMAENRNRTELETGLLENPMNQDDPLQQFIDSKQQKQSVAAQTELKAILPAKAQTVPEIARQSTAQHEPQGHSNGSPSSDQSATASNFYIQFGSFALRANAEASVNRLKTAVIYQPLIFCNKVIYTVSSAAHLPAALKPAQCYSKIHYKPAPYYSSDKAKYKVTVLSRAPIANSQRRIAPLLYQAG